MRQVISVLGITCLLMAAPVSAEGWFDTLKSWLGFEQPETQADELTAAPSIDGVLSALVENLGISEQQAKGGLASLLQFAKQNVSAETFADLSDQLPGLDALLRAVPKIGAIQQGGLAGLLDKAAEYSESLKSVNDLKKQFEALDMSPDMILRFVEQAQAYFDTDQGMQTKTLLEESFNGLQI